MKATSLGNIDLINYFHNKGLKINDKDYNNESTLLKVAKFCNLETIKYLISKGCNINDIDNNNENIMFKSTYNNNIDVFKYLINKGFDIKQKNIEGKSIIDLIIINNNITLFDYLISNKIIDINYKDENGHTLLIKAAEFNNIDIAKYLINKYYNLININYFKESAFEYSLKNQNYEFIELFLINGLNLNLINPDNLKSKIRFCSFQIKKLIFRYIPNNNFWFEQSLIWAVESCDKKFLRYILENKIIQKKEKIYQALELCIYNHCDLDIIKEFFKFGININYKYKDGESIFIKITSNYIYIDNQFIDFLFIQHPDFNLTNTNNDNALMLAIRNNNLYLTKKLIDKKINLNHQNKFGETSIHILLNNIYPYKDEYTEQDIYYLDINPDKLKNTKDLLKILISKGANLNIKSLDGTTPLMIAAEKGHIDIVKFLVENGARVDEKNKNGESAFEIAKKYYNPKITIYLNNIKSK